MIINAENSRCVSGKGQLVQINAIEKKTHKGSAERLKNQGKTRRKLIVSGRKMGHVGTGVMNGCKVSNSEGAETTGEWNEHWRDAGDRMREMREENVALAGRNGKAVSQSCQGLLALLMSSGGECRQTQPTLWLATSASDIILSENAKRSSEVIQIVPASGWRLWRSPCVCWHPSA